MERRRLWLTLALVGMTGVACLTPLRLFAADAQPNCASFDTRRGGYQISTAFAVDTQRQAVISPPSCLGNEDLLRVKPLRLNPDDYLILQKCNNADCTKAEVVRAWNVYGYMGPYPVLAPNIRVAEGVRYMLWLQHVRVPGNHTFSQIDRYSPPLVFTPVGSVTEYSQSALKTAAQNGPVQVKKAAPKDAEFVVTFKGGSVVWMQALRPES
jgi:hypothetical protein